MSLSHVSFFCSCSFFMWSVGVFKAPSHCHPSVFGTWTCCSSARRTACMRPCMLHVIIFNHWCASTAKRTNYTVIMVTRWSRLRATMKTVDRSWRYYLFVHCWIIEEANWKRLAEDLGYLCGSGQMHRSNISWFWSSLNMMIAGFHCLAEEYRPTPLVSKLPNLEAADLCI